MTLGLACLALALGSCVTHSASVYIAGVLPVDAASCSFSVGGSTLALTRASVSAGVDVKVAVVVENLIQQRNFNVATNVSTVIINQAEITLTDSFGASIQPAFLVDVPGGIVPGSTDGISPGQGVVIVPVIPVATLATYPGITSETSITANIIVRGRTNGDIDVEGGPFSWTITLLPATMLAGVCDPTTAVSCCFPGQNGEARCTNLPGYCAPSN